MSRRWCLPFAVLGLLPLLVFGQGAGEKHALLVGVNSYRNANFLELKYAERDVDEMAALLRANGYSVTLLKGADANAAAIRSALARLVRDRARGDMVLVGMAGHGRIDEKLGSCFCPQDADLTAPAATMVTMTAVLDQLKNCGAGAKLLLVDACRESRKAGERGGIDDLPEVPRGVGVLLSCSADQKSFELDSAKHGLFFHNVLEGLRGSAKTEDGEVTWDTLREYVKRRVPKDVAKHIAGGEQVPHDIGNLTKVPVLARVKVRPKDRLEDTLEDALIREMKFVHVPKGTFWMGWDSKKEQSKQVTIDADFELAAYTVTQGQWEAVMGKNPSYFSRQGKFKDRVKDLSDEEVKRLPVENVSWNNSQEFLAKLNERERGKGWRYRLPREAEWEYACRGAATTKEECSYDYYLAKPTNDLSSAEANFWGAAKKGPYLDRTAKVGSYQPNKLGLYDMHGNVFQWCDDLDGSFRVFRGGSWRSSAGYCAAAHRDASTPADADNDLGLRVARVPSGG